LSTALESYGEADEVFLYAGDSPTADAWQRVLESVKLPCPVHLEHQPFMIARPQDICAAKNRSIDDVVGRTDCDSLLIVDPDVALAPGWAAALSDFCGKRAPPPFRLFIQNAIAYVDVGLMPFGTVMMPRGFTGRLVWDGSYFSPQDPAAPGFPLALHLGYLTIKAIRRHLARNRTVWAEFIGAGGVRLLDRYCMLDDRSLAREVLLDLRDRRRPGVHQLSYSALGGRLQLITSSKTDLVGRDLAPWYAQVIDQLGAAAELDLIRKVIDEIGPTSLNPTTGDPNPA
jgi:hypothetical protein